MVTLVQRVVPSHSFHQTVPLQLILASNIVVIQVKCLIPASETISDLCENCNTVMDQVKLR